MSIQSHFERKFAEKATYRVESGADHHTLRYVRWLESRLAEEIKCGHRNCKMENCFSSGVDCPAQLRTIEG